MNTLICISPVRKVSELILGMVANILNLFFAFTLSFFVNLNTAKIMENM